MNPSFSLYAGRFALLRHEYSTVAPNLPDSPLSTSNSDTNASDSGIVADHWDLMLEADDGQLLTWQLPQLPSRDHGTIVYRLAAKRIANHRSVYLQYEGPVSRNRGHVRQIAIGRYTAVINPTRESNSAELHASELELWLALRDALSRAELAANSNSATLPAAVDPEKCPDRFSMSLPLADTETPATIAIRLHGTAWIADLLITQCAVDHQVRLLWQFV